MRTGFRILFVSFILMACKSGNYIPYGILSQSKMQEVLWDMVRADQFLNDYSLPVDSSLNREKESIQLYRQIFQIHNISKEQFQQSLSFYRDHPSLFKPILDSIDVHSANAPTEVVLPPVMNDTTRPFTDTSKFIRKKKRLPVQ